MDDIKKIRVDDHIYYVKPNTLLSDQLDKSNQVEKLANKAYYPIGEVAQILKINPSNIRHWESEFDWLRPEKRYQQFRRYTKDDIQKIMTVNIAINVGGMTHAGVRTAYACGYLFHVTQIFIDGVRNCKKPIDPKLAKYPLTMDECFKSGIKHT
jgi:hypothetical protein